MRKESTNAESLRGWRIRRDAFGRDVCARRLESAYMPTTTVGTYAPTATAYGLVTQKGCQAALDSKTSAPCPVRRSSWRRQ